MKINEKESLYYLRFPQIILEIKVNAKKLDNPLKSIENTIIEIPSSKPSSSMSNKFDKKYKNNNLDIIESRKNKSKLNKKNRKNIDINEGDIFNDELGNRNLIKPHKLNKGRKKEKNNLNHVDDNSINLLNNLNRSIVINSPLSIEELSQKLLIPETEIITYLFLRGIPVTINEVIDISTAQEIALHYNFNILENLKNSTRDFEDNSEKDNNIGQSVDRAPIIVVFGHVDHGKTTLLDCILKTELVRKEYGSITQAINGYEITYRYQYNDNYFVFLDTPGHEAFSSMRLRGAKVADIALLVIAADDGLKPQTIEVIKMILELKLNYIIVINKIDKPNNQISQIKEKLNEYGMLSQDCGGDTVIIEVSALNKINIDILMDKICILSKKQNLLANPNQLAEGTILESYLDRSKGVIARSLVQNGTLKKGDLVVSGNTSGRIKSILDFNSNQVNIASPSSVVQILGFVKMPEAGLSFKVVENDKQVKKMIKNYISLPDTTISSRLLNTRISLTNKEISQVTKIKQLNIILKTDTQGSLEALIMSLYTIPQNKVQINLISSETGNISRTDLDLASASNSIIIGFNVIIMPDILIVVKRNNLILRTFNVIYDLLDYVNISMLDLVELEYESIIIGKAVVQTVFSVNKGTVAGCIVNEGKLKKKSYINIYRNNTIVYNTIVSSLKRMKDDVEEVLDNNECGVMCNDYNDWEPNDVLEIYELKGKEKVL